MRTLKVAGIYDNLDFCKQKGDDWNDTVCQQKF